MSDEPQNKPELICLNQSYEGFKKSVEQAVLIEIITRFIEKKPFTLEVRFDDQGAMYGDWASVKFTPPKTRAASEESKP